MTECGTCGQTHQATSGQRPCTSHKRSTGEPCKKSARIGQDVCNHHGGNSPQAKAAAERRIAEERAKAAVKTYGLKIETTATEALLEEVKWTAGHVQWLREKVQEFEAKALVWGQTRKKIGGDDWGHTEEAKPNAFLALYQSERTHLVKVCAEAIRAGIEERRVRLAEQQGELIATVIRDIATAILDALLAAGLTPNLAEVFNATFTKEAPERMLRLVG